MQAGWCEFRKLALLLTIWSPRCRSRYFTGSVSHSCHAVLPLLTRGSPVQAVMELTPTPLDSSRAEMYHDEWSRGTSPCKTCRCEINNFTSRSTSVLLMNGSELYKAMLGAPLGCDGSPKKEGKLQQMDDLAASTAQGTAVPRLPEAVDDSRRRIWSKPPQVFLGMPHSGHARPPRVRSHTFC